MSPRSDVSTWQVVRDERARKYDLMGGYGYAYVLNESNVLCVTDWGRASKYEHVQPWSGVEGVWIVYWVAVYTRDFASMWRDFRGDIGWVLWTRYPVKAVEDMEQLFMRYLGTCGLYKRVSYCVEKWEWSEGNLWDPADCV